MRSLNGVEVTIIGTSVPTAHPSVFAPLPESKLDGEDYAVIPGACNLGVKLRNTTGQRKRVIVKVDGEKAVRCHVPPYICTVITTWSYEGASALPIRVEPVRTTTGAVSTSMRDMATLEVSVCTLVAKPSPSARMRQTREYISGGAAAVIPEGKKSVEIGFGAKKPAYNIVTQWGTGTYARQDDVESNVWHYRDKLGLDVARQQRGLLPLSRGQGSGSTATFFPAFPGFPWFPATFSFGSAGNGISDSSYPLAGSGSSASSSAALAGSKRHRYEEKEETQQPASRLVVKEAVHIDLTQEGSKPVVTKLVKVHVAKNDGQLGVKTIYVMDPQGDVSGTTRSRGKSNSAAASAAAGAGDVDRWGRDSFLRDLLRVASETLELPSQALCAWGSDGRKLLTRSDVLGCAPRGKHPTAVVGVGVMERFVKPRVL